MLLLNGAIPGTSKAWGWGGHAEGALASPPPRCAWVRNGSAGHEHIWRNQVICPTSVWLLHLDTIMKWNRLGSHPAVVTWISAKVHQEWLSITLSMIHDHSTLHYHYALKRFVACTLWTGRSLWSLQKCYLSCSHSNILFAGGCIFNKGRWQHFLEHLLPIILLQSNPDAVDNLYVNHGDNLFSVSSAEVVLWLLCLSDVGDAIVPME